MFTGIVQGKATLEALKQQSGLSTLVFQFPDDTVAGITIGASVAIDGTCLTVTHQAGSHLTFDVMQETLRLTTLGDLVEGDTVNFERAARIGDEIGGHLLSGHIHTTGHLTLVETSENNCTLHFRVPTQWLRYIFAKGYIGINGASLTVGDVVGDTFTVHLIPETLRVTTFGGLTADDRVNLEIDSQTQTIVDTLTRLGYGKT